MYYGAVTHAWLADRQSRKVFDWRYYLVKYPSMRRGTTGIYYGIDGKLGYSLCMLRTKQRNGYYRDPILLEVWRASQVADRVQDPWFTGYETNPRWLRLVRSGVALRSVADGFAIRGPEDEDRRPIFDSVCAAHPDIDASGDRIVLTVPQEDHGDGPVDAIDRVVVGAALLNELVGAGL